MPIINIDKGTILKGQAITPAWYKGSLRKAGPHEMTGDKINLVAVFDFEDPTLKADDRTIDHTFYNAAGKGVGFLVPLMSALLKKPAKEIADALERGQSIAFDIDQHVGEKLQFKLINEPYQGRIINKIETFLPYEAEIAI